jgi:hypothetical protein
MEPLGALYVQCVRAYAYNSIVRACVRYMMRGSGVVTLSRGQRLAA